MTTIPFSDLAKLLPSLVQDNLNFLTHDNDQDISFSSVRAQPSPAHDQTQPRPAIEGECLKPNQFFGPDEPVVFCSLNSFEADTKNPSPTRIFAEIMLTSTTACIRMFEEESDHDCSMIASFSGEIVTENNGMIRVAALPYYENEKMITGQVKLSTKNFDAATPTPEPDVARAFFNCLAAILVACQTGAPVDPAAVAALKAVKMAAPFNR